MPKKPQGGEKMVIVSLHVTPKQLQLLDRLVMLGLYANRSDAIRAGIRLLFQHHCDVLGLCANNGSAPGSAPKPPSESVLEEDVQFLDAR